VLVLQGCISKFTKNFHTFRHFLLLFSFSASSKTTQVEKSTSSFEPINNIIINDMIKIHDDYKASFPTRNLSRTA